MKKIVTFLMIVTVMLTLSACNTPSPSVSSEFMWICEDPYMWFEMRQSELGTLGYGEIKGSSGALVDARFGISMGFCDIYREEDIYLTAEKNGDKEIPIIHEGEPILSGRYEMHNTVLKVFPEYDQIYNGAYSVLEFHRQAKSDVQN